MLATLQQVAHENPSLWPGVDVGDLIQVGIALIMLWAVTVSKRSAEAAEQGVQATKEGIKAQLLYQLSSEFWSEEFGKACADLGEFAGREEFLEIYRQELIWQDGVAVFEGPEAPLVGPPPLDMERRRIKGYYHTVKRLHEAGFFTREEVKEQLTSAANMPLLLGPVEQLETVITPGYNPEDEEDAHLYRFFGELYPELERPVLK